MFDIAAFGDAVAFELASAGGVVELALDEVLGLVDDELDDDGLDDDGDVLGDDDVDGDVLGDDDVDGDVLGLIDELDDVEPLGVDGVVVEDDEELDGDGVTTGGVVEEGVFVSR